MTKQLTGLYAAIADGLRSPGLQDQLLQLEAKQTELKAKIAATPPPQPRFHPRLAQVYRGMVADLHGALSDETKRTEAANVLRKLVERIEVRCEGKSHTIRLVGNILRLLTLPGGSVPDPYESAVKVVAGAGFEPTTFRL